MEVGGKPFRYELVNTDLAGDNFAQIVEPDEDKVLQPYQLYNQYSFIAL